MTEPAQITDGQAFVGNDWTDIILLPTHRTNSDGTQGSAIDWTGSAFTVDTPGLPVGVTMIVTPALGATPPSVTLSLTEADTAQIVKSFFRWYLRSTVLYDGDAFCWRRVKVSREQ